MFLVFFFFDRGIIIIQTTFLIMIVIVKALHPLQHRSGFIYPTLLTIITKASQKFCSILVRSSLQNVYDVTLTLVVYNIIVEGALISCALLLCKGDLKAAQMNVQRRLIREVKLYGFEHCPQVNTAP